LIEEQAIARCHRMGQARPVDVHRLLAEDSVDQRMLEILATKAALFDEYVRRSELKEISPDAVDVSSIDEAKRVASLAEEETATRTRGLTRSPGDVPQGSLKLTCRRADRLENRTRNRFGYRGATPHLARSSLGSREQSRLPPARWASRQV
jgi:hypothetical protein